MPTDIQTDALTRSPEVSVCMLAYNHERFIAQAIDSVLHQETDFEVELVIGEDCSTDGTRAIVAGYQSRYPDRVRSILNERNIGAQANFRRTFAACRGQYVAMLECDDYWTSARKLQTQIDFMEAHHEYALCFTNVLVVYDRPDLQSHPGYSNTPVPAHDGYQPIFGRPVERTTRYDLARGNYIHTPGVLFRNWLLDHAMPDYFDGKCMIDWSLHMFTVQFGDIHYFDEVMAAYRVHGAGAWSAQTSVRKKYVSLMQYPAMLQSPVFDDKIKAIWREQLPRWFLHYWSIAPQQDSGKELGEMAEALTRSWGSPFACALAKEYAENQIELNQTAWKLQAATAELERIRSFWAFRFLLSIRRLLGSFRRREKGGRAGEPGSAPSENQR